MSKKERQLGADTDSQEGGTYVVRRIPDSKSQFEITVTSGRYSGRKAILTEISPRFAYYNLNKKEQIGR